MPRSLLVLGAIAAASVCGVWVHATRAPVSPTPEPRAERAAPSAAVATPSSESPAIAASTEAVAKPARPKKAPAQRSTIAPPADDTPARTVSDAARIGEPAPGAALTIAEAQSLARLEAEGLVTIRNPDGSETLNHEGRFQEHVIIRVGANGAHEVMCVSGQAAAQRALRSPVKAAPKKEGD